MARVYALMKLTDPAGEEREIGESFDWPRESDQDKADFDRAVDNGLVTTNDPNPAEAKDNTDESGQRTSRRKG